MVRYVEENPVDERRYIPDYTLFSHQRRTVIGWIAYKKVTHTHTHNSTKKNKQFGTRHAARGTTYSCHGKQTKKKKSQPRRRSHARESRTEAE